MSEDQTQNAVPDAEIPVGTGAPPSVPPYFGDTWGQHFHAPQVPEPSHLSNRTRSTLIIAAAVAVCLVITLAGYGFRTAVAQSLTAARPLPPACQVASGDWPVPKDAGSGVYVDEDLNFEAWFPVKPTRTTIKDYVPGGNNDFYDVSGFDSTTGAFYGVTASCKQGHPTSKGYKAWLDDILAHPTQEKFQMKATKTSPIIIDGRQALDADLENTSSELSGQVSFIALLTTETREYQISAHGITRQEWEKFLTSIRFHAPQSQL